MKMPDFFICQIASLNFFPISCTYIMRYFFKFDKELNKEVAIEAVDLEEAWVPNINFTMCLYHSFSSGVPLWIIIIYIEY